MSLESKIDTLTAAVVALTAALQDRQASPVVAPQAAQMTVGQAPAPAPVMPQAPAFTAPPAPVAPPAAMPALPSFAPPAPAAPAGAPFTDLAGLVKYATESYAALGPKGEMIGQVMAQLGHDNINNIRPDQYGQFYAAVEALKV